MPVLVPGVPALAAGSIVIFQVRLATPDDGDAMLALMPRLGDFEISESRVREHLYRDDARLLQKWIDGGAEDCVVHIATGSDNEMLGFTLFRLRPEPLSREPSAHLEAIAVAQSAEGKGVAKALLAAAEASAVDHGAESVTLHVIESNSRARGFYEHSGYYGEMIRYIKRLR